MLYLAGVAAALGVTVSITNVIKLMLSCTNVSSSGIVTVVITRVSIGVRSNSYVSAQVTVNVTVVRVGVGNCAYVCTALYVTGCVAIVVVIVEGLAGVVTALYVTGLVATAVKNVIRFTNVATALCITVSIASEAVNVGDLTSEVTTLYVTVGIASVVEHVVAFPVSVKSDALCNGVVNEIPRSSVFECPANEHVAVLRRSFGCRKMITLAYDGGFYHISTYGIKLYGQSVLSFAARGKSKYSQSNAQHKYCDLGGESNIFHTSSRKHIISNYNYITKRYNLSIEKSVFIIFIIRKLK